MLRCSSRLSRAVVAAAVLCSACDLTINAGGGSGTGTGTGGGGTGGPTSPSPTPTPTPPGNGPTGGRTPDPPLGVVLPLPTYGPEVLASISVPESQHCADFGFLDALVTALRTRDTRWGYFCKDPSCAIASFDKIAYHAVAGPEVTGALGNQVVDVINSACESPTRQWIPMGFDLTAAWTSRGRF